MSKIIRISEESFLKLSHLEKEMENSKQEIIDKALEKLARENLLVRAHKAYENLRNNPNLLQEDIEEQKEWESTLNDGLENL